MSKRNTEDWHSKYVNLKVLLYREACSSYLWLRRYKRLEKEFEKLEKENRRLRLLVGREN